MRLENKVAMITGSGRGIGRAAAELFAREGAKVVVCERDVVLGEGAVQAIRDAGGEATFVETDVSLGEDVRRAVDTVRETYGALHVLYNNASIFSANHDGPLTELTEETWRKILAVNLDSVFFCCKYAIPLIVDSGGGSVINTASSAAVIGVPGCDAYTATKGATLALTRSLAVELGPSRVRVNCIAPAGIETDMLRENYIESGAGGESDFFRRAPFGRYGTAEEVAQLALFLASDESGYISGAIIRADGASTITPIA